MRNNKITLHNNAIIKFKKCFLQINLFFILQNEPAQVARSHTKLIVSNMHIIQKITGKFYSNNRSFDHDVTQKSLFNTLFNCQGNGWMHSK